MNAATYFIENMEVD